MIPHVVHATPHVLVSDWVESPASLASLIDAGHPEERSHYGGLFARFLIEGPARAGMLHADPHPGNFRLLPAARTAPRADSACWTSAPWPGCRTASFRPVIGRLMRAAVDEKYDDVLAGLRAEGFIKPHIRLEADDLRDYIEPFLEPFAAEEFEFTRSYMREQAARVPRDKVSLRLNLPPAYLLIQRTWVGGVGVLCQLETRARLRELLEKYLPGF